MGPDSGWRHLARRSRPDGYGTATFHAGSPSFYYARVLQVPTSRWSVFDCQRAPAANPTDCAPSGKLNVQIAERAWTSPVWYLP